MKENICTIPVNEIFEVSDGCPICRMRNLIESRCIDYITGAAMMEPDIRVITNKSGFCTRHFRDMLNLGKQRLPICLMLVSHVAETERQMLAKPDSASVKKLEALEESCYVCDYIESNLARALDTVYRSYRDEEDFRKLFAAQPQLCLPHYRRMVAESKKTLGRQYGAFCEKSHELALNQSKLLRSQLKQFEDSFDHRNAGVPMPAEARDSLERTVEFLTGRSPKQ